jgi:hypothetical protein
LKAWTHRRRECARARSNSWTTGDVRRGLTLDTAGLERNLARAADLCPVSNALRDHVDITVWEDGDET